MNHQITFKRYVDFYHKIYQERINYPREALIDLIRINEDDILKHQAEIQAMRDLIPLVKE